jgi:hypothetical protein
MKDSMIYCPHDTARSQIENKKIERNRERISLAKEYEQMGRAATEAAISSKVTYGK